MERVLKQTTEGAGGYKTRPYATGVGRVRGDAPVVAEFISAFIDDAISPTESTGGQGEGGHETRTYGMGVPT